MPKVAKERPTENIITVCKPNNNFHHTIWGQRNEEKSYGMLIEIVVSTKSTDKQLHQTNVPSNAKRRQPLVHKKELFSTKNATTNAFSTEQH